MPADVPSKWPARFMALLTLVIVVAIAASGWWRLEPRDTPARGQSPRYASTQPVLVQPGNDYYAHVKLIELNPTKPDGGSWEMRSASAPDIYFRLSWNGTLVFESAVRDDRLIAEWDLLSLDLKDAILSGEVEVASALNAPLIRAEAGGMLALEIFDEDASFDDEAGRFDIPVENLRVGINTLTPQEGGTARVVLDMVPRDMPLPDLLERASNR
jgi:hypothetical protein